MPADLFFRTEDIRVEDVLSYLVETDIDRQAIENLKGRSPIILRGSRGVGKSFLLRAAEAELKQTNASDILPVYVTFARASLIRDPTPHRFLTWMLAKICGRIIRAAIEQGIQVPQSSAISAIRANDENSTPSVMERVSAEFEQSWQLNSQSEDPTALVPGPEVLGDALEDLCRSAGLSRIVLFVDEAAHVFLPQQQRQFFTLMRDLRSPYLSIKAAVYPGVTAFGDSFQPTHDATVVSVDRNITTDGYLDLMRSLVLKQDATLLGEIKPRGEEFAALAYASTGNPRILLKTLSRSSPFRRPIVQQTIRSYYREEMWAEHSNLAERYPGHAPLIDWGRSFIEGRCSQISIGETREERLTHLHTYGYTEMLPKQLKKHFDCYVIAVSYRRAYQGYVRLGVSRELDIWST